VSLARFACGRIAGVVMNFLSVHLVLLFLFFAFLLLSLIGILIIKSAGFFALLSG
jgi:hypothetical protein